MRPFLKWAGGKRWLVLEHGHLLTASSGRLVEPFLGSGAVFFHVEPPRALLSDSNEQLVETYEAVKAAPQEVWKALKDHALSHSKEHYYQVRASVPGAATMRAARFIYLNRTCFNGLYRVNLKGEFNVPRGTKDAVVLPDDDFLAWSQLLQRAELVAEDFEETLAKVTSDDLVYVDPPYTVNHNANNFLKYNERIFSWADQVRLSGCLQDATAKGARVIVSNADHASVRDLYPEPDWTQLTVSRFSRLAASSDYRRPTTEVLISNCIREDGSPTEPHVCQ